MLVNSIIACNNRNPCSTVLLCMYTMYAPLCYFHFDMVLPYSSVPCPHSVRWWDDSNYSKNSKHTLFRLYKLLHGLINSVSHASHKHKSKFCVLNAKHKSISKYLISSDCCKFTPLGQLPECSAILIVCLACFLDAAVWTWLALALSWSHRLQWPSQWTSKILLALLHLHVSLLTMLLLGLLQISCWAQQPKSSCSRLVWLFPLFWCLGIMDIQ